MVCRTTNNPKHCIGMTWNNNGGSTTTNNRSLLLKLYKQKCRVCGDHNVLCNEEQIKECHNCENAIIWGESQTGSIGMDGSFVGQLVEVYNENTNIWQAKKLVNYNFSKDMKDVKSYTLLIEHNDESISGITLPDEYIRFALPWSIHVIQLFNIV